MCTWFNGSRYGSNCITLIEWLMEMQLDRKAGGMLKADLERQGMNIELQANSKEIIGKDDVEAIKL